VTTMERLTALVRTVFDDDSIPIGRETTAQDVDGWDSLSHVNLILAIENAFRIKFTQKELLTFRNVGDLHDSIEEKTGGSGKASPR
jgi:acyl carrier protein